MRIRNNTTNIVDDVAIISGIEHPEYQLPIQTNFSGFKLAAQYPIQVSGSLLQEFILKA